MPRGLPPSLGVVTARQAAEWLRVSPRTFARYTAAGLLDQAGTVGAARVFHLADVHSLRRRLKITSSRGGKEVVTNGEEQPAS